MARPLYYQKFKRGAASLVAKHSTDPSYSSRELALRTIFLGTLSLAFVAFAVVCSNYFLLHLEYLAPRIAVVGAVLAIVLALYICALKGYFRVGAYGLLALYFGAATGAVWQWGIETPVGILLMSLVVIFAGILLGARYSLYATGVAVAVQAVFVAAVQSDKVHPDTSWVLSPAGPYDVVVFGIILGNIALVSWLFNRSMEQSLRRAERSERALKHQNEMLEAIVEERTREAQVAQLERIQELHRFAEFGHMSVALLHDMANYLSVLSLDIEGLKETRQNRSAAMGRVQESIHHLNSLIKQVRHQIKGETSVVTFNVADEIDQVVKILRYKADTQRVVFEWLEKPERKDLTYTGSINHFWQIILNILSNGIDAYDGHEQKKRTVCVRAAREDGGIVIRITDYGKGISEAAQQKVFEPFYSTKKDGTGIGLAITKRMVEKDFGGSIRVESDGKRGTTFAIVLPNKT